MNSLAGARHFLGRGALALAAAVVLTSCGSSSQGDHQAFNEPTTHQPSTARVDAQAPDDAPITNDDLAKLLEERGYRSEPLGDSPDYITADQAIAAVEKEYGLFSQGDPSVAYLYSITSRAQNYEGSPGPNSPAIGPVLDNVAMWVVYAEAKAHEIADPSVVFDAEFVGLVYADTGMVDSISY